MSQSRIMLSVGTGIGRKIMFTVVFGSAALFMIVGAVIKVGQVRGGDGSNLSGFLCAGPWLLVFLFRLVAIWLPEAWLQGTTLTLRGAWIRTRSIDLALADVLLSPYPPPGLGLTDQNGQTMHLPLYCRSNVSRWPSTAGPLLPAAQMMALAAALEASRSATADRSRTIAGQLRAMANL